MRALTLILLTTILTGCDDGDNGNNGNDSLVLQTPIAALSADCSFGGVQIDSGLDRNNNNSLDPNEVDATDVICNGSDAPELDVAVRDLIATKELTGDPTIGRILPSIDDPVAHLGMLLFFTKGLGGDQDSACVTCHHPFLGGGDGKSLPVGVEAEFPDLLGPGRNHSAAGVDFDGGPTVPRNAPTTFNMGLWDQFLFHDGRVESLSKTPLMNGADGDIRTPDSSFGQADPNAGANLTAAQARFPVTSPEEMRGHTFEAGNSNTALRAHLEQRFQNSVIPVELATNNWLSAFQSAYNQPAGTAAELITFDNIASAIADYENSQIFVDTAFARYVQGDNTAMTAEAKLGAALFFGDADCAGCHSTDFFTDEQFHVLAMPQIGRGKGNDNGTNTDDDFGRFRETGVEEDRYAFRTPTLLNVEVTGPYGHAGAYTSLHNVIRHHGDPEGSVVNFDLNQLEPGIQADNLQTNTRFALDTLATLRQAGNSALPDIELSDENVSQLVAFMNALTDSCVADRDCVGRWIPGITDADPDDLRVRATNRLGDAL